MAKIEDREWGFAIEVPDGWNRFPVVPTNSPYEVARFASQERGFHLLIVFRHPRDRAEALAERVAETQSTLANGGFGNFSAGEAAIASRDTMYLDFDKPAEAGVWSCREYFVPHESLLYVLGFGTSDRLTMLPLFEHVAQSFQTIAPAA